MADEEKANGWMSPPEPSDKFPGWREEGRSSHLAFLGIVLQLLLAVGVIHWLGLESGRGLTRPIESWWQAFDPVNGGLVSLLAVGFLVHSFLPGRWRFPFFLVLSWLGAFLILGWFDGGLLILFGLILVGLCHLPIPFGWRVAAVLLAGLGFGLLRAGIVPSSFSSTVIPVLASLFMFRMIIYLYDLRNEAPGVTPWQRLGYFFLAPNVCFPLFPVVDYGTYLRTWYDQRDLAIYQKGVRWISRGVVHLVLYRVIYQHFSPAPEEVDSLTGVVVFVVSSYLLYLRISGQFHLIIGLLSLFGFNLPETHHRYLLASGFSDYWRRINIYWKDFMMKIVFYPSYVRFKRLGPTKAIALGTALVFFATWFLHGFQWFWLRGRFHFSLVDALFWAFFAILVIINALHEVRKKPSPRKAGKGEAGGFDFRHALRISLQTAAMFTLICLLFSFWQSESIAQFFGVLSQGADAKPGEVARLLGLAALGIGLGVLIPWITYRMGSRLTTLEARPWVPAFATVVPLALIVLLGSERGQRALGARAEPLLAAIRSTSLNARDQRRLDRGYYEGLLQRENFGSQLWEVRLEQRPDWEPVERGGMSRLTGDLLHQELIPNQDIEVNGIRWVTNRWAMHDHDSYEKEKPPRTYRIAMMSASYGAGYGMPVEATFENVVEEVLNQNRGQEIDRIEILNFSVPGYTLIEFLAFLETRIAEFEPDAFFLVTHSKEGSRTLATLGRRIREGVPVTYEWLETVPERAGIPENPTEQDWRKITRLRDEVEEWGYGRMVEFCRDHDMTPVWIWLPVTDEIEVDTEALAAMRARAEAAGFHTLSLEGAYGEGDRSGLYLFPHDRHPNIEGHRRIAEKMLGELEAKAEEIGLPLEKK